MTKEKTLSSEIVISDHGKKYDFIYTEKVKEFIKKRIYDATMLLGLFNSGKLTLIDLRKHRQRIKEEAGDKLT